MSLPYTYLVPLLITDLLSCIFAIEDRNVMLMIVGLFCMLYRACNTVEGGLTAGARKSLTFPLLFLSANGNALSRRSGSLMLRLLPSPIYSQREETLPS